VQEQRLENYAPKTDKFALSPHSSGISIRPDYRQLYSMTGWLALVTACPELVEGSGFDLSYLIEVTIKIPFFPFGPVFKDTGLFLKKFIPSPKWLILIQLLLSGQ